MVNTDIKHHQTCVITPKVSGKLTSCSSGNLPCVLGVFDITKHTNIRLAIQYNYRIFLWNYIWIFVQQFIN